MKRDWNSALKPILIQVSLLSVITFSALVWDWTPNRHAERELASDPIDLTQLKDFDYQLTNIATHSEAQKIFDSLEQDLEYNFALECGSRAHVWSWQMKKNFNINSGKIYLYYTPKSFNHTGMLWGVHVVPYVVIDGKEYVMEKIKEYAFGSKGYFLKENLLFSGPVLLSDWLEKLTGFSQCRELSITAPDDRQWLDYFKDVWKIPADNENCFVQKSPMNYIWPISLHNKVFNGSPVGEINRADAVFSCQKSITGDKKKARRARCEALL